MFDLGDDTKIGFTMALNERPQARLENFGANALSDTELLAVILQGNGVRPELAVNLAASLIAEAGSIAGLLSWTAPDYRRVKGIGHVKGLQLSTIAEIARRMMATQHQEPPLMNRAALVAARFTATVSGLQVEKFWVLCLNRKSRLTKQVEVTSGTATSTLAHPREVYRAAIRESATGIVCVHNHPSGDPAPSSPDVQITRLWEASHKRVYANCQIMGTGLSGRRRVSTGTNHDDGVGASHN